MLKYVLTAALLTGLASAPSQAQQINYLSNAGETTPGIVAIRKLTEEFAAETGAPAVFAFDAANQQNIMQRVQILAASDGLPLLFQLPDRSALRVLYDNGQLVNIMEKFTELGILDQIDPFFVGRLQNSENAGPDVLYELPITPSIEGIVYNKAIFAAHELEIPTSWDEFLAVNQTLLDAGIQPLTAGGADSWPLLRWVGMYAHRLMGNDIMDKVRAGEVPLTEPGFAEAVGSVAQLVKAGYFGNAVSTMSYSTSLDQFKQGGAAMMWGGNSIIYGMADSPVPIEDLGLFNFPTVPNGLGTADAWIVSGLTTAVSKAAYDTDPEGYNAWFEYVATHLGEKSLENGFISGFVTSDEPRADDPMNLYRAVLPTVGAGLWPWEQHFSSRAFIMAGTTIPLVLDGSLSIEQYLADLEAAN